MPGSEPGRRVGNLPAETSSFVGRRREITDIKQVLSTTRLVTLTGVGGVGKTRVALRVAGQLRRAFRHGVWLIELASLGQADLLAQTIAAALGQVDSLIRPPVHTLTDYLADKQILLVLDNCEHLADACAPLIGKLLLAAPDLRVLTTSRHPLHVNGEHVVPIQPLTVPDPGEAVPPSAVAEYDAVRLFAERGAAAHAGFEVTTGNQAQVVTICHRLDGIPLAIELATAWLRALSPEQILARMDDRFRLLTRGSRTAPPRHRTLQAMLDWSYDLCSPAEQTLWGRLTVFAGGFDLRAAEAVCQAADVAREDVFDVVAALVDKSVVRRNGHGFEARYRMLETVRQYGQHKLRETGEHARLRLRHRDYFHGLAQRCEQNWFGPNQVEWCARLRSDHANLRAALHFCHTEPGEARTGMRMASALWSYGVACGGPPAEERYWLDRLLALDTTPSRERAKALCGASTTAARQGDSQACGAIGEQARELATRLGDEASLANALRVIGLGALMSGDLHRAAGLFEESIERYKGMGPPGTDLVVCYFELAATRLFLGDLDGAGALCAHAVALCEAHGEQWALSHVLNVFVLVEFQRGGMGRASEHARKCLRIKQKLHDVMGIRTAIEQLAWIAAADGDAERAARLLGAAQQTWQTYSLTPVISESHLARDDECETRARQAIGDQDFEVAFTRGTSLALKQAIAYALGDTAQQPVAPAETDRTPTPLTRREQQVAELVAEGLSNKQIAKRLVIAQRTAEGHVERILNKLGFTSRTQIATWVTEQRRG